MSAAIPLAVYAAWLAAGFAFVLWGLRIFKAWIALLGVIAGGALGSTAGVLIGGETPAILVGAVIGAGAGMLLAWPLQKLLVFLGAGSAGAMLGAVALLAFDQGDLAVPGAIIGFLLAGISVLVIHDTVVIGAMAFQGAQAVFHAVFVPLSTFDGSLYDIGARLLAIYADQAIALVVTTMLFIAFALWYQKGLTRQADPVDARAMRAVTARRVSVRYAGLILASWLLTAVLATRGDWSLSPFELAGIHALSWPLVTLATLMFLRPRPVEATVAAPRRRARRLLDLALFGVVVPPVLTVALFALYGAPWQTIAGFYLSFIDGPTTALAAKLGYSLAVFPMLLATAVPAPRAAPAAQAPPPPPEQPETVQAA